MVEQGIEFFEAGDLVINQFGYQEIQSELLKLVSALLNLYIEAVQQINSLAQFPFPPHYPSLDPTFFTRRFSLT